jgi:hypothetical protein
VRIDEVVKTKTSDLFKNKLSLSRQFYSESIIKKAISLSINGEHADDFIMKMIQSFSNRK